MDNSPQQGFVLGDWRVSPDEGQLARGSQIERLEPKVMEVLVYLAAHPGQVISRDELERKIWRGALVGYDAVSATILKLRKALNDDARQPRLIATIPKKGYQLIGPVQFPANGLQADNVQETVPAAKVAFLSRFLVNPRRLIVVGLIAALAALLVWRMPGLTGSSSLPSIVVMPIESLDSNERQGRMADGLTEDIITDLSRLSNLMVLSSNTGFYLKTQPQTTQALREALQVDYVLKGNIRTLGDDIRINLQLINARNGFNVWAQRYDRRRRDIFAIQDDIAKSLVEVLAIEQTLQEKQKVVRRPTHNLEAYEQFLKGQRFSREQTRQANAQAQAAYQQAIRLDPAYGRAYGALAYTLALDYRRGWTDSPAESIERALEMAQQGVQLDPSSPYTHWSLGFVHLRRQEHELARQAVLESIRVAPNFSDGYGLLALIHNGLGEARLALEYVQRGMQLDPFYSWHYLFNAGYSHYLLGHYAQAVEYLEQAQSRNEQVMPIKLVLAASYVRLNRMEDAEWEAEQIRMLDPSETISHIDKSITLKVPKLKAAYLEDLRKAGMPE